MRKSKSNAPNSSSFATPKPYDVSALIAEFYDKTATWLVPHVFRKRDVPDLNQTVWMIICKTWDPKRGGRSCFVYKVCSNVWIDYCRHEKLTLEKRQELWEHWVLMREERAECESFAAAHLRYADAQAFLCDLFSLRAKPHQILVYLLGKKLFYNWALDESRACKMPLKSLAVWVKAKFRQAGELPDGVDESGFDTFIAKIPSTAPSLEAWFTRYAGDPAKVRDNWAKARYNWVSRIDIRLGVLKMRRDRKKNA